MYTGYSLIVVAIVFFSGYWCLSNGFNWESIPLDNYGFPWLTLLWVNNFIVVALFPAIIY